MGGSISDELYERRGAEEKNRGIILTPPNATSRTVLFAHGTGNDLAYPLLDLYRTLFLSGIRVCAFDLDGHGVQGTSNFSPASINTFMDWAVQTIKVAPENLFLAGHSLGGVLALDFAARNPDLIAELILISAPVLLEATATALFAESLSAVRPSVYAALKTYGAWCLLPALGPFKRASYPIRLLGTNTNYVRTVDEVIRGLALRNRLSSITAPTLLVYGTGDFIVPIENARILSEALSNATTYTVSGATHFSTVLEQGVADKIADFVMKPSEQVRTR